MNQTNHLAQQIALWGDRLRDISAMGLRFSQGVYDQANYRAIQDMAIEMQALSGGELPEALEPLRVPVFNRPTPLVTGDAAIFDQQERILLIRRADNGLWAMPGGALEVGETPAEGVLREALEETGWRCEAVALIGVFDSRFCGSVTRNHLYHFQFLCRPLAHESGAPGANAPSHANEVLETAWFAEAELPATLDPGHVRRIPAAFRFFHGEIPTYFDPPETRLR
jgi:ADP-ribose pyrophosphatase YjhB (NUDIX family)